MKLRSSYRAFTLFEVMLAIGIFVLLTGAIFTVVGVATKSAAILGQEQVQSRKLDAFIRFCRSGFLALPGEAEVSLRTRETGSLGRAVELVIGKASGAFWTGVTEASGSSVVLAALPDGHGSSSFAIARYSGRLSPDESLRFLEKAEWVPVLEGLTLVKWRFLDPTTQKYTEEWDPARGRPELVQLEFATTGDEARTVTFRVPKIGKATSNKVVQHKAPNT